LVKCQEQAPVIFFIIYFLRCQKSNLLVQLSACAYCNINWDCEFKDLFCFWKDFYSI